MGSRGTLPPLLRNSTCFQNCTRPSIPKNGRKSRRCSRSEDSTGAKSNAGKSGSTSWTPRSTRTNGKSGSSRSCTRCMSRWGRSGVWFRKSSAGTLPPYSGLRTKSRTASTAPSATISAFWPATSSRAVATTGRSANFLPAFSMTSTALVHVNSL